MEVSCLWALHVRKEKTNMRVYLEFMYTQEVQQISFVHW